MFVATMTFRPGGPPYDLAPARNRRSFVVAVVGGMNTEVSRLWNRWMTRLLRGSGGIRLLVGFFCTCLDLFLSRQENEDIARSLEPVNCQYGSYRGFNVTLLSFFGVKHVHRVCPPGRLQQRHQPSLLQAEMSLELSSVERGGHDNQPKVCSLFDELFQERHQDICRESTLVDFVEDYRRATGQGQIRHGLAEEHTVRHIFEEGAIWRRGILESDRVSDLFSKWDCRRRFEGRRVSDTIQ